MFTKKSVLILVTLLLLAALLLAGCGDNANHEPETVAYTVESYYDGVLDGSKTESLTGDVGAIITEVVDKAGDDYTVDLDRPANLPFTLAEDAQENVIKVYYIITPTDPTKPTDPAASTDPKNPTNPTNPTNSTKPSNPTNPTNPANPTTPKPEPTVTSVTIAKTGELQLGKSLVLTATVNGTNNPSTAVNWGWKLPDGVTCRVDGNKLILFASMNAEIGANAEVTAVSVQDASKMTSETITLKAFEGDKYYLTLMSSDGLEIDAETFAAQGIDISNVYLEFKSGNQFVLKMEINDLGINESVAGTCTIIGNKVTLNADGDLLAGTFSDNGNSITLKDDALLLVFGRKPSYYGAN